MFKTLKTSVASFIEDREGNFAIMFACVASAVMISVGVAVWCFALAFVAIWQLKETFGKDLNYYENS